MKLLRLILFITVFSASFLYGCQAAQNVTLPKAGVEASLASTLKEPAPLPVEFPNGQRNILLVLTDSLDTAEPQLEGVWLVLVFPPAPRLTLMPIYPASSTPDLAFSESLVTAFGIEEVDGKKQASAEFLQIIRDDDILWSDLMIIDRGGLGTILDYMNGGAFSQAENRPAPTGALLLDDFANIQKDPGKSLDAQVGVFQEVCWGASQFDFRIGLTRLLEKLDGRMISSAQPEETTAALTMMQISTGSLTCEFPTLAPQAAH